MKHNEIILRNKYFYNEVPKTFDRGCIYVMTKVQTI